MLKPSHPPADWQARRILSAAYGGAAGVSGRRSCSLAGPLCRPAALGGPVSARPLPGALALSNPLCPLHLPPLPLSLPATSPSSPPTGPWPCAPCCSLCRCRLTGHSCRRLSDMTMLPGPLLHTHGTPPGGWHSPGYTRPDLFLRCPHPHQLPHTLPSPTPTRLRTWSRASRPSCPRWVWVVVMFGSASDLFPFLAGTAHQQQLCLSSTHSPLYCCPSSPPFCATAAHVHS